MGGHGHGYSQRLNTETGFTDHRLLEQNDNLVILRPYSETWFKPIPKILLGSISRETQKCQFWAIGLFRIQRGGIKLCLVLFITRYKDLYRVQIP